MLIGSHLRRVGLLLSEVAQPRSLTTAESAWVTGVLGALPDHVQAQVELRMSHEGPLLIGAGPMAGLVVRRDGDVTTTVVGDVVWRSRSRDEAVLALLGELACQESAHR